MLNYDELYKRTCSISNPRDGSVVFIRNEDYYNKNIVNLIDFNLIFIVSSDWKKINIYRKHRFIKVLDPEYEFALYHNWLCNNYYLYNPPYTKRNLTHHTSSIHKHAVIGADGLHIAVSKEDPLKKVQLIHIGNVVIKNNVTILANTVVERGVFDSTVIDEWTTIDNLCLIGHNSHIGPGNIIAAGAIIGGSVITGINVSIGLNSTIRNGVSICNDVIVGMGSVVLHDITEPGVYAGNPVRKISEYKGQFLR